MDDSGVMPDPIEEDEDCLGDVLGCLVCDDEFNEIIDLAPEFSLTEDLISSSD